MDDRYPMTLPRPRVFCAAWARGCRDAARRFSDPETAAHFRGMAREWIAEGKENPRPERAAKNNLATGKFSLHP